VQLRDLTRLALRRRALIGATVALVCAIAIIVSFLMSPRYSASVTLRLATASSLSGDAIRADAVDFAERLQNTYASIARSGRMREALADDLKLSEIPEVEVELKPGSELMTFTVITGEKSTPVKAANRLADLLITEVRDLETGRLTELDRSFGDRTAQLEDEIVAIQNEIDGIVASGRTDSTFQFRLEELRSNLSAKRSALLEQRQEFELARLSFVERLNSLSVVERARVALEPGRKLPVALVLGLGVGLVAGVGLAAIYENLGSRVTPDNIETILHAPVLGELAVPEWSLVAPTNGDADEYRRIRTELLSQTERRGMRTVLVTSAERASAAPAVAANIAAALARAEHHVVVVDGDIGDPILHAVFDTPNGTGLAEALLDEAAIENAPKATSIASLRLLPAGIVDARDAMTPSRVGKLIAALEERYELVVVSAPSPFESASSLTFVSEIAGVVVVVSPNSRRTDLSRLRSRLEESGSRVAGVVVLGSAGQ
jgi:Mrp family chromosome partitioning ATPase/capsular polysaccharide biosynthesis protein